ncbi:PRC-barrel domain containing protein [Streptomyces sp. NPDC096132]|uniref:PRC-barrel domain containing protein n=1 Tax=Streptomyces sp. NPDC096132 TaxID=3366075 RepID=UPI00382DA227
MTIDGIWSYAMRSGHEEGEDLTDWTVVAADGAIGHVEREAAPHGLRHVVVDTGVWLFGRSVVVPVGLVTGIDRTARTVSLSCTGDRVREAPRFRTDGETTDRRYLAEVGAYYERLGSSGTEPR